MYIKCAILALAVLSPVSTILPHLCIAPIGQIHLAKDHEHPAILIHQLNHAHPSHIYLVDTSNDLLIPALAPFYKPIDIQLLPSRTEFSFIDEGSLRIKNFDSRAAKTIRLSDKRITYINTHAWLDDDTCLITAFKPCHSMQDKGNVAERGTYGIYMQDRKGKTLTLVSSPLFDALLPCPCTESFFYIRRNVEDVLCAVVCQSLMDENQCELITENCRGGEFDYLIPVSEREVYCFLYENGNYVCLQCVKYFDVWISKPLFTFHAKRCGYLDPLHLYSPLLIENQLFIYLDNNQLHFFNLTTKATGILQKTYNIGDHADKICAPCYINGKVYCGYFTVDKNESFTKYHQENTRCSSLPTFQVQHLLQRNTPIEAIRNECDE